MKVSFTEEKNHVMQGCLSYQSLEKKKKSQFPMAEIESGNMK